MKSTKKLLSLLLVLAMVFTLAIPAFAVEETTPVSLVTWTGGTSVTNNGTNDVLSGVELTMKDSGTELNAYGTLGVSASTYGNLSVQPWYGTTNFSATNYGYMEFVVSTTGYTDLKLTTVLGNNGKAPASYDVFVSVDGEPFVQAQSQLTAPSSKVNNITNAITSSVILPEVASDAASVTIQVRQAEAANNANNAGNLYLYEMALTGAEKASEPPVVKDLEGKTIILHSNDVHGAIEGYAYMTALKASYVARGAEVIMVDAGDYSQGTTYVSTTKGLDAVMMMNVAGYNIATLGNHEFDYGYAQLKDNLSNASFTVLCANVLDENGDPIFDANMIKEVGGVKIGFFGLETPEAQTKTNPALIKGLTFLAEDEMYECAAAQVADLKAKGADVIVCLSHLGVDAESVPNRSYDLFAKVSGIDFIIDAHSHSVMTAGVNNEPIQSTGTAFANIGVVVIDNATKAIVDNYLVPTTDLEKNEFVLAEAQKIVGRVKAEYGVVFAKSEVELNGDKAPGNRNMETNLGDLITDAMLWQTLKDVDSLSVPAENIVAITNGGGIRAWIHAGDVTKQDVNTVLPFGNTLAVVYVKGSELLEALEASTYCTPGAVGGFPQVAGMKFTVVTSATYKANAETYPASTYYGPASINRVTIDEINGKAFDPNATYAVVTNNFCAAGGDTYYAFASATSQFDTGLPLDEVLMSYITDELNGVIGAEQYANPAGRITVKEFTDIDKSGYKSGIINAYDAGIIGGFGDGTFRPNKDVTRAEFITMIWKLVGRPTAENTELTFADAASISDNYKMAVAWGVENGIIMGWSDNTFRGNNPITRAQMATFVYRFCCLIEDNDAPDELKVPVGFEDQDSIDAAYAEAVNVMANMKLINGFEDGTFRPNATANRGQAATILYRLYRLYSLIDG